jgi:chromosome segregation ATPase
MSKEVHGKITELAGPVSFNVKPLHKPTVAGASPEEIVAYRNELKTVQNQMAAGQEKMEKLTKQISAMATALSRATMAPGKLHEDLYALQSQIDDLERKLEGSPSRDAVGEKSPPTAQDHFFAGFRGLSTTYGPTPNMRRSLGIAADMIKEIVPKIDALAAKLPALHKQLKAAGAPYIMGMGEE